MFTVSNSPIDTFISLDDALAELTDLSDQLESARSLYIPVRNALDDINTRLNQFVKDSHGATDATAIIEALIEEFGLSASRRVSATVTVQYTVSADVPYTKTLDEFEEALGDLDYGINLRYGMNDYDMIDAYVEDIDITDIDED